MPKKEPLAPEEKPESAPEAEPEAEPESAELAPTPADQWTTPEDRVVTLTSGNRLRVREVAIVWMTATGRTPPHIVAIQKKHQADKKDWSADERELLLDWFITQAAVEPKISLAPRKGALHIKAISDVDKEDIVIALNLAAFLPR